MRTRRDVLNCAVRAGTGLAFLPYDAAAAPAPSSGALVNDVHSQLNETRVDRVVAVESEAALRAAIKAARRDGKAIAIAGGRHSMGGQQFASGAVVIDTRPMRRELRLDAKRGIVEADAGIQWPELVDRLIAMQKGQAPQWGIVQKQTGADRLTLGGALSSNIHGRGLKFRPFIGDVEAFTIMDGNGALRIGYRVAGLVDKILKGAKPGDIPIFQPTGRDASCCVRRSHCNRCNGHFRSSLPAAIQNPDEQTRVGAT